MTNNLSDHDLNQRKAAMLALMDRIADAQVRDSGALDDTRVIAATANVPSDPPFQLALFEYVERYEHVAPGSWRLTEYYYEFQQRPPPGRRAHHRHEPWGAHAHCVDPHEPDRSDHFRDVELDVFEAHGEFLRFYARGEPIDCAGLFPLARDR